MKMAGKKSVNSLNKESDFRKIFQEGKKLSGSDLTIFGLEGESRLAIRVPKAYGKAVRRNRLRRVLKEALRKKSLSCDLIVMIKKSGLEKSPEELRESLLKLLEKENFIGEKKDFLN